MAGRRAKVETASRRFSSRPRRTVASIQCIARVAVSGLGLLSGSVGLPGRLHLNDAPAGMEVVGRDVGGTKSSGTSNQGVSHRFCAVRVPCFPWGRRPGLGDGEAEGAPTRGKAVRPRDVVRMFSRRTLRCDFRRPRVLPGRGLSHERDSSPNNEKFAGRENRAGETTGQGGISGGGHGPGTWPRTDIPEAFCSGHRARRLPGRSGRAFSGSGSRMPGPLIRPARG